MADDASNRNHWYTIPQSRFHYTAFAG